MKVSIAPSSGPFKNKFLVYGLFVACSFYWCFNFVCLFVCLFVLDCMDDLLEGLDDDEDFLDEALLL